MIKYCTRLIIVNGSERIASGKFPVPTRKLFHQLPFRRSSQKYYRCHVTIDESQFMNGDAVRKFVFSYLSLPDPVPTPHFNTIGFSRSTRVVNT